MRRAQSRLPQAQSEVKEAVVAAELRSLSVIAKVTDAQPVVKAVRQDGRTTKQGNAKKSWKRRVHKQVEDTTSTRRRYRLLLCR